jgi:hypothetical protein
MRLTRLLPVLLLSLAASAPAARADSALSPADAAALHSFQLSEDFLQRYMAAGDEIAKDPCRLGMVDLLKQGDRPGSIDQLASHYDAQPGVHAMLARHGLSAREMVLGMVTLTGAAVEELRKLHPEAVQGGDGSMVSASNLRFYDAHKAQIRQHNQAIAYQQLKANGGKLPACLK